MIKHWGFNRPVKKSMCVICALLGCYAVYSGNSLPTLRDNLWVPSSRVKKPGPIGCSETSVRNYHYTVRSVSEKRGFIYVFYWFCVCGVWVCVCGVCVVCVCVWCVCVCVVCVCVMCVCGMCVWCVCGMCVCGVCVWCV
jgi:hypothetical protein